MRPSSPFPSSFFFPTLRVVLATFLLVIAWEGAFAQIDRAEVEGTVKDPSGAAVAGASVKILAVDTDLTQEQRTNSNGYYRFPGLAVGRYTITVASTGFKTRVTEGVRLQVGQIRTLDIGLEVGALAEKVDVRASTAPSDRTSAEASTVIDSVQIANLPNNGRDWASFTLLAPFAQDTGGTRENWQLSAQSSGKIPDRMQ